MSALKTYIVGRMYRVPVVWWNPWRPGWIKKEWHTVPILGPLHEDREIINFPHEHWHVDWRFASDRLVEQNPNRAGGVHSLVITKSHINGGVEYRRLKCRRAMPTSSSSNFPNNAFVPWLEKLENAHEGQCLKTGRICPHRGMPLAGCPVENGIITCPAHGLRWRAKDGSLFISP